MYNVDYAQEIVGTLFSALGLTVQFVAFVIPAGFVLGFFMGWARTSSSWFLRALGTTYVEFFRGMPPIVLVFFSWLIATLVLRRYLGIEDPSGPAFAVGIFALALHSGSYQAEIVRAGILSVPTGQLEAADAIGLTRWQAMFRITLPQAFRVSLPALGNEFASLIKDTSLLTVIGAFELSQTGLLLVIDALIDRQDFNLIFIVWTEIALLYFAVTFLVTRAVRGIENVFKVPGLEAAQL